MALALTGIGRTAAVAFARKGAKVVVAGLLAVIPKRQGNDTLLD
jgi:hypothetical protein